MIIKAKVYETKHNSQKRLTVPAWCDIEAGDTVMLVKIEEKKEKE